MSTAQILAELPNLPKPDLKAIRRRLQELAERDEDVALCDQAALAGAQLLDRMEEEDARLSKGRGLER
ncbi:MAG: hypothetical protein A2107_02620 [Verrucomicrobia bacterium GWF2_62_7]|nr:MAG: hypothetical protein A2107_02620 [Verrucomicrobia bacterium GWF2_62_7]